MMWSKISVYALLLGLNLHIFAECASIQGSRASQSLKGRSGHFWHSQNASNLYETKFPEVTWDQDNWRLTTTTFDQGRYQSRGSVANGYMGINVANVGPFFELDTATDGNEISGWPLFHRRQTFATISGFYDLQPTVNQTNFPWMGQYGGESIISGIPHWSGLVLDLGDGTYLDSKVDNRTISDFSSTYDFKAGLLSWSYRWTPLGDKGSFNITYRLFAHKLNVNLAVVDMEIVPSVQTKAKVINVIDGCSAVRTDFAESGEDNGAIFTAVRPFGMSNVTAYVYANITGSDDVDLSSRTVLPNPNPYVNANDSSIAQAVDVKFSPKRRVRINKFVGAASSDAFTHPRWTAKRAASSGLQTGYRQSLRSHASEWAYVMPWESVDDYTYPENGTLPADDHVISSAIISVTSTYYLLQNTVSKNAIKGVSGAPLNRDSISAGGLTSDSYGGLIFWDADTWMHPGLVASHPEAAQRITNYRVAKYPQALSNAQTAFAGSKNRTVFSASAAVYPWTSGRFGNCTGTGPCWDYEYHINGDIGQSFVNQWIANGDTDYFREELFPIYNSVSTFYSDLLERNGSSWVLSNMTDPDEYANNVDNGGYTMPLIATTLQNANEFRRQFGLQPNDTWTEMAKNAFILRENNVTLEFSTMNGSTTVKQADVVLATYPLSYNDNYGPEKSLSDLNYYSNKQSPDGPAMTWAIFAIVANEVAPSGCSAYTYAQNAYEPYMRAPFFQLSEQMVDDPNENGGTHPAYPFLTGHGGTNQVDLFGYLGLRLLPDDSLYINPNLPPQIPHLRYRTFYWHGWPLSASSNYTHTTIRRANTSRLETADAQYANVSIPVRVGPVSSTNATIYRLTTTGTLTVPNRRIASIKSTPGDLIQCRPVRSKSEYSPGQFPIGAVDGAASTKWQPRSAVNVSSMTVSLGNTPGSGSELTATSVTGFHYKWASAPPVNAAVVFHNITLSERDMLNLTNSIFTAPWPDSSSFSSSSDSNDGNGNSSSSGGGGKEEKRFSVISRLLNITISDPFNPDTADPDAIVPPSGNTTNVTLSESVPVARFATLFVQGNQGLGRGGIEAGDGPGPTVSGWAIIGR